MNRAISVHSRRTRTLGLLVAVVAAGFALAALGVVLVHVVTDQPLPWATIPVYTVLTLATLGVVAVVGWTILPAAPAERVANDHEETAYEAQRRLLDDVRHELKTPITIVRGHLEVMDPNDPSDAAAIRDLHGIDRCGGNILGDPDRAARRGCPRSARRHGIADGRGNAA